MTDYEQALQKAILCFHRGNKLLSDSERFLGPDGITEVEDDDILYLTLRGTILTTIAMEKQDAAYAGGMNLHVLKRHMRALSVAIKILKYAVQNKKEVT